MLSLKENNERLEQVVKANGGNVDELVSLVQENQVLLRQMKVYSFSSGIMMMPFLLFHCEARTHCIHTLLYSQYTLGKHTPSSTTRCSQISITKRY